MSYFQNGNSCGDKAYCLQTTAAGHPSHPLYLKKSLCPMLTAEMP